MDRRVSELMIEDRVIFMPINTKCLIQIDGGDGLFFLGEHGDYTQHIQAAQIFMSELDAYTYVDKHGLHKLARVRKIVSSKKDQNNPS